MIEFYKLSIIVTVSSLTSLFLDQRDCPFMQVNNYIIHKPTELKVRNKIKIVKTNTIGPRIQLSNYVVCQIHTVNMHTYKYELNK